MLLDQVALNAKPIWTLPGMTGDKKEPIAEQSPEQTSPPATPGRDVCDISANWETAVDWEEMLKSYLDQLRTQNRNVDIVIADPGENGLHDFAASLGTGAHLVLSTDFLRRMASGAASFYKGKTVLEDLVHRLSTAGQSGTGAGAYVEEDSVVFWSASKKQESVKQPWEEKAESMKNLFKTMDDMRKEAEKNKKKFQVKINGNVYQSPAQAMTRLAQATTIGHVKNAMAMAERNIYTLKLALSLGPENEKPKVRAALAALEKVISRGSRKVQDLNEEDDLFRRQKRAEQESRRRRAEQMKYELEQKQTSRRSRERAQITEGQPWFYYQQELMRKRQISVERPEAENLQQVSGAEVTAAVAPDSGGGEFCASDVVVSPAIAIAI